jgi:hypothetical protein
MNQSGVTHPVVLYRPKPRRKARQAEDIKENTQLMACRRRGGPVEVAGSDGVDLSAGDDRSGAELCFAPDEVSLLVPAEEPG